MLKIENFVVNPFQENTYIVSNEEKEAIIIDPGMYSNEEKQSITQYIENNNLSIKKIVNTHGHVDHLLGVNYIKNIFNCQHYYNEKDEAIIKGAKEHGLVFGFNLDQPELPGEYLNEGDKIVLGNDSLDVIHVPGHSPGHIALYSKESGFVLVGDVLFAGSIGRTDLPGGDYDTLINSIKEKLFRLPGDTIVYSGHGPSSTIENEKTSNPFFS